MIDFLTKNYIWFLFIALLFSFSLFGLIIERNQKKPKKIKDPEKNLDESISKIASSGMTLGDALDKKDEVNQNNPKDNKSIVDEPK